MTAVLSDVRIALCGLGGQGILFLARVIAEAARAGGRDVLAAETHGMSQRGGAVEAHVKIGDFESSLVRRGSADLVFALDESRVEAARALLAPEGVCVASSRASLPGVQTVDAAGIAKELGAPRSANLVLLGFASEVAARCLPSSASLRDALERSSPAPAREANRKAFERGSRLA